jgi:hypothetical protein
MLMAHKICQKGMDLLNGVLYALAPESDAYREGIDEQAHDAI